MSKNSIILFVSCAALTFVSSACTSMEQNSASRSKRKSGAEGTTPRILRHLVAQSPYPHFEQLRSARTGTWAQWETTDQGGTTRTRLTVVARKDNVAWLERTRDSLIIRTGIRLDNGKVTYAAARQPDQKWNPIKIQHRSSDPKEQPTDPKVENVTVPAGSFSCSKLTGPGGQTIWRSTQKRFDGLVKEVNQTSSYVSIRELVEFNSGFVSVPGGNFHCTYTRYRTTVGSQASWMRTWNSQRVPFSGLVKKETLGSMTVLIGHGSDAAQTRQRPR